MPALKSDDPLIALSVRLPTSLVEHLRGRATTENKTISDVLRAHCSLAQAKPLGKPVPRRRPPKLAPVSGVDPALMRQLAAIGGNLNQIAHRVNSAALSADALSTLKVLTELQQIERHLRAIADHHAA